MTEFTTDNVHITSSNERVFDYLMDMNNYEGLFPEDRISDFQANEDSFSVKIAGQGRITLKRTEVVKKREDHIRSIG